MRNPWCEMFQAYAPASPNATRSPARSLLTRTRRASTSLGVHSCPAIVTGCPVTPGRGHDARHSGTGSTAKGWSWPLAAGVRRWWVPPATSARRHDRQSLPGSPK